MDSDSCLIYLSCDSNKNMQAIVCQIPRMSIKLLGSVWWLISSTIPCCSEVDYEASRQSGKLSRLLIHFVNHCKEISLHVFVLDEFGREFDMSLRLMEYNICNGSFHFQKIYSSNLYQNITFQLQSEPIYNGLKLFLL